MARIDIRNPRTAKDPFRSMWLSSANKVLSDGTLSVRNGRGSLQVVADVNVGNGFRVHA